MSIFGCKSCDKCSNKSCSEEIIAGKLPKVALVGNPNVGKSVIFNALSGFYVEVSNYPGTTVDVSKAFTEFGEIIDTPGAYSLGNYTDDEIVTQNIVQSADIIVNIVSALSLERDLFLTQQLIDMGFAVILVVNQIDEAEKKGIYTDCDKLGQMMGIKVIPAVAIRNKGIAEIVNAVKNGEFIISDNKTPFVNKLLGQQDLSRCDRFLKLLELESQESKNPEDRDIICVERRKIVNELVDKVISHTEKRKSLSDYIGDLLLNPVSGVIIALIILYLLFQTIGVFVSGQIVDFLFTNLDQKYSPWIEGLVKQVIPAPYINEILVGEFGALTMTVEIVIGVLLPLIIAFYLFMAVLEDSGYLPRLAVLTDNLLNKIGLNGRAVIPILLGFGCGAMGTITTRILGSKKERTIATAILGVTIPCAAQQGIIIALIAAIGGLKIWAIYLGVIFIIMALVGTVLDRLIPGKSTDLLIDLPPIRLPLLFNTFNKTLFRVINFLKEAIPLFAFSSVLITILSMAGFLKWLQQALSPIVVHMLRLPAEFSDIFVMGLIRRDMASVGLLGMAGLEENTGVLTDLQILVASIVVTLFVPCIAALIVIYKERGLKEASLVWIGAFIISILTGAILSRILQFII
ncbi:MAG TPA: ferrous iron transport protein B [Candidatus Gastranaerophilales bacterium]|nr:ferrous iron transport protein B [Candidatus Gastranaerophilales bacterium]